MPEGSKDHQNVLFENNHILNANWIGLLLSSIKGRIPMARTNRHDLALP